MLKKSRISYSKSIVLIVDVVLLIFFYLLSYFAVFKNLTCFFYSEHRVLLLLAVVLWLFLVFFYKAYTVVRQEKLEVYLFRSFKVIFFHAFLFFSLILLLQLRDFSREVLLLFYVKFFVFSTVFRIIYVQILKDRRRKGYNVKNIVILGCNESSNQLASYLTHDLSLGYNIVGYFDYEKKCRNGSCKRLGDISDVILYVKNNKIHELYISSTDFDKDIIHEIIEYCESHFVRIKIIPTFNKYTLSKRVSVDFYGNLPIVYLRKEPLQLPLNIFTKRAFDVLFSLCVLLVTVPLLYPIIILAIKLSSPGTIFFLQKRSGKNNEAFNCLKFRSMRCNIDSDLRQATKGDDRITPVGKILRKTSLDEIPQFINVLRGDMSIVGPRPHMLEHTKQYSALIKGYLVRHYIKPGITGWAQVNGLRGETKTLDLMQKRVEFDIWYIENWTFLLDIKIIFKTIFNMLKGEENAA